jgi:outer membrane lipoprotein-sorting protein
VSELSELYELLHGADQSFRTLRATIRNWRDDEIYMEAFEHHTQERKRRGESLGSLTVIFDPDEDEGEPEPADELVRLWIERPDRMREEVEGRWARTQVNDGETSWMHTPQWGAVRGPSARQPAQHLLLEPAPLLSGLEFVVGGKTNFSGRDAIVVTATPRRAEWHDLYGLAPGADRYELVVDGERGVLLRAAALFHGKEFALSEILSVAFDEPLDPTVFVFTPPAGEAVRSMEEAFGTRTENVTIEEAARRAPFPVWIPRRVPDGWHMDVHYHEASERPSIPATVSIHYATTEADDVEQFSLNETAAPEAELAAGGDWKRIERDGQTLFVYAPTQARTSLPSLVIVEREGTRVRLSSDDLDREALLELACSLERAPTEPRRLIQ